MKVRVWTTLATVLGVALTGGCAGTNKMEHPTPVDLSGTWQLVRYGGPEQWVAPLAETVVTITLDQGAKSISGTAGCNQFRGALIVDGGAVAVGPLAMTKKLCPEPDGVMQQETDVTNAVAAVKTFEVDGDTLYLAYGQEQRLVWNRVAVSPTAGTAAP